MACGCILLCCCHSWMIYNMYFAWLLYVFSNWMWVRDFCWWCMCEKIVVNKSGRRWYIVDIWVFRLAQEIIYSIKLCFYIVMNKVMKRKLKIIYELRTKFKVRFHFFTTCNKKWKNIPSLLCKIEFFVMICGLIFCLHNV